MDTTQNVLQKSLGATEYAKLLNSADQISIFGEPVKELSREELLAALSFAMQANQERGEQHSKESNFKHLAAKSQSAGLW